VKKRFPTLQHLVESGILNDNEREIIQKIDEMYIQVKNTGLKNGHDSVVVVQTDQLAAAVAPGHFAYRIIIMQRRRKTFILPRDYSLGHGKSHESNFCIFLKSVHSSIKDILLVHRKDD